jgi:hypothetical protein
LADEKLRLSLAYDLGKRDVVDNLMLKYKLKPPNQEE